MLSPYLRSGLIFAVLACLLCQCRQSKPLPPYTGKNTSAPEILLSYQLGRPFSYVAADGVSLPGRYFPAVGRCRGSCVAVHGFLSHSGWMAAMATHLTQSGYEVWCPDRRGSGLQTPEKGNIRHWQQWTADLEACTRYVSKHQRSPHLYLLGYSLGAPIAVSYLVDQEAKTGRSPYTQAVLLAPGFEAHPDQLSPILKTTLLGVAALLPGMRVKLPPPPETAGSAGMREVLTQDPAMLRSVTLRYLREVDAMQRSAMRSFPVLKTPLTVLVLQEERIVDNQTTRDLCQERSPRVSPREVSGAWHAFPSEEPKRAGDEVLRALTAPPVR